MINVFDWTARVAAGSMASLHEQVEQIVFYQARMRAAALDRMAEEWLCAGAFPADLSFVWDVLGGNTRFR